jgi:hypothetical protein
VVPFGIFGIFSIFFLAATVFWIWALVDCIRVPADSMYKSGNKIVWVLVIVFLHVIGAIVYLIVGRPEGGPAAAYPRGPLPPVPPPPS